MGRPRTAHPSQPIARPPVPGSSGWGHTGVAQGQSAPGRAPQAAAGVKAVQQSRCQNNLWGVFHARCSGWLAKPWDFQDVLRKKKKSSVWVCGSSGCDGAGWARAILQQHPQPSCPQGHVIVAAPVSLWIDATKVISVTRDVCQREGAAAGTGCLTPLPSQCPCSLPPVLEPGEVCAAADAHGQKQHCGLGSPRSH